MIKVLKESEMAPDTPEAVTNNRWYLFCPGCYAQAQAERPDEPRTWIYAALHCFSDRVHQFNGNVESPTLQPSLLVTGSKRCHSYVREGQIQFLSDCSHPLANQTVPLMDAQVYLDAQNG